MKHGEVEAFIMNSQPFLTYLLQHMRIVDTMFGEQKAGNLIF